LTVCGAGSISPWGVAASAGAPVGCGRTAEATGIGAAGSGAAAPAEAAEPSVPGGGGGETPCISPGLAEGDAAAAAPGGCAIPGGGGGEGNGILPEDGPGGVAIEGNEGGPPDMPGGVAIEGELAAAPGGGGGAGMLPAVADSDPSGRAQSGNGQTVELLGISLPHHRQRFTARALQCGLRPQPKSPVPRRPARRRRRSGSG